ncbi:uncharacterized protein LY89DRAFT_642850 [Mollisia scopiformis]|uniref:Heterokaryon incompatibility domain-containing protein n=1 Tax=Mollisia scopiformis TaxID=149040 RepID=A0A194XE94_MOLSC|nr:uncharacterized protein LY89DRAFT_642850 [Mollisia scopiformis]KUJ18505.1 hypothetical protein LY89DRAFT_642850 [Mollisia scopiformis]
MAAFDITISRNPAKMRALLNLWFAADFKPTFISDRAPQLEGFDDVELLGPSTTETRVPMRMFDLDTKNLVDYPDVGGLGQYCMLSHRWMDREVDYAFISNARLLDFNRAMLDLKARDEGGPRSHEHGQEARQNDVQMIKAQCDVEIEEHEQTIKSLINPSLDELGMRSSPDIIAELLLRRTKVKAAKQMLYQAKKDVDEKLSKERYAELEEEVFRDLMKEMGIAEEDASEIKELAEMESKETEGTESETSSETTAQQIDPRTADDIGFFKHHSRVREAIDKMVTLLQQRKSAIKIEKSIEQAKDILDKKLFPKGQKRYLWLDTCCINKSNDREFTESLSLMGDWYANADFCLVYLDKTNAAQQWVEEWQHFKTKSAPTANITSFRDIFGSEPEWSTRGWTLQELVMSKMTYYVNSLWEPLGRPIENIGAFYYFCPFIQIYCNGDVNNPYAEALDVIENVETLTNLLHESKVEVRILVHENVSDEGAQPEVNFQTEKTKVQIAQTLITMLEVLGVQIPKNIDMDTAKPQITQSIHFASTKLVSAQTAGKPATDLLLALKTSVEACISEKLRTDRLELRHAKQLINLLLRCLVKVTEALIKEDRRYIAEFGNVQDLRTWQDGTARSGFSTHKVMSLACKRRCFVPTDRAYSLMGLLGVRYPVFHAEGLNKAMVRLLDEVVISSNDVSVFNWTGKHLGSPIKGRSLYPSTLEAYAAQKNEMRQMVKNKKLAEMLQIQRYEVTEVFVGITSMLRDAITFVKDSKEKALPLGWLKEILLVVKDADYAALTPHLDNLAKILMWIQQTFSPQPTLDEKATGDPAKSESEKIEKATSSSSSSLPFGLHAPQYPSFDTASLRTKLGDKRTELQSSISSQLTKRSLSTKATPEDLTKKWNDEVIAYIKNIDPPKDDTTTSIPVPVPTAESSNSDQVTLKPATAPELPQEFQQVLADIKTREFIQPNTKPEEMETMISPNPIIVNSSGIEGVFDIQRVVVTMLQPEKLRRQIDSAVTPHQKITGWCTISTGFALVMVGFCCEKRILEQELNVINVVEHKVLKEVKKEEQGRNRLARRTTTSSDMTKAMGTPTLSSPTSPLLGGTLSPQTEEMKVDQKDDNDDIEEANQVTRMIKFVQEPDLNSIAGEWVLARFSGVPGAKWFLCHVELGSTHNFYGHRIPTDEINFYDASPEMGLVKYWDVYMMRKKTKLCGIFEALLQSKDMGNTKAQMAEALGDLGHSVEGGEPDSDTESKPASSYFDQKLEQGGMLAMKVGAGLFQSLWELQADQLEKNLNAAVLKKIPAHLQAAIESLNENKDLLPAMFHSARRIHMF